MATSSAAVGIVTVCTTTLWGKTSIVPKKSTWHPSVQLVDDGVELLSEPDPVTVVVKLETWVIVLPEMVRVEVVGRVNVETDKIVVGCVSVVVVGWLKIDVTVVRDPEMLVVKVVVDKDETVAVVGCVRTDVCVRIDVRVVKPPEMLVTIVVVDRDETVVVVGWVRTDVRVVKDPEMLVVNVVVEKEETVVVVGCVVTDV
jgi:hypothetical protein